MFYKVIKDDQVIDLIAGYPQYVLFQERNQMLVICEPRDAMGIVSSDGENIWHIEGCYPFPFNKYISAWLVKIDREEYIALGGKHAK